MNEELKNKILELSAQERAKLQQSVDVYLEKFLTSLPSQKAFVNDQFNHTQQDEGFVIDGGINTIENLLDLIRDRVDDTGLNSASGGHLGYIPGGGIYASALGDYIAAATNRYAGVFYSSPGAVRIENALIQWAGDVVGYPKGFGGNLTTGGSTANLIALSTAKTTKKIKSKDIENAVIYTTRQSHHSVIKGLKMVGLDECVIRIIPISSQFKMQTKALDNQIQKDKNKGLRPFLIIANAGSTDVGAVDDISEIANISEKENLWLHIDGAYGGFFMLTDHGKEKLKGIERADSVILDPHKTLFLPYGSGMVLVKNVNHLLETFSFEANYMQDAKEWHQELSPTELSPELSRNFRGLRMWLALKLHGTKPFEDYLNEKLALSQYFYKSVQKLGFETGNEPDLTVCIFRLNPKNKDSEAINKAILKSIHEDGRIFISSTQINDKFWLRTAILSFRTHKKEIDTLLDMLKTAKQEIMA